MDPQESSKLDKLGQKLEILKGQAAGQGQTGAEMNRDVSMAGLGWRMSLELLAGIVVGLGLGYALDGWLGTKPLFMIILMLLGLGGGFMNVIRVSKNVEKKLEAAKKDNN